MKCAVRFPFFIFLLHDQKAARMTRKLERQESQDDRKAGLRGKSEQPGKPWNNLNYFEGPKHPALKVVVMRKKGGRKGAKRSQYVSDRSD
jgi:hypothetical protein